jgi:hypothetical protein
MKRRKDTKPGYARLLDAWTAPANAGEPLGCVATSYTFSSAFFEEECLGRFVHLETDAAEDGGAFLIEREEKFSQLMCAAAIVDQRHARGLRSLRWDLLSARVPNNGILHSKISLLLWTNAARLIIASANLTEDGYRRNHEVFGVLDYMPGGTVPLNVITNVVAFVEQIMNSVAPGSGAVDPAVTRCRRFLRQFSQATSAWGGTDNQRSSSTRITTILSGPARSNVFEGVKASWREATPPSKVWIVSPFFDPPESQNAPAREIWKQLRQRGNASVCYAVAGETVEGSETIRLLAPEALRWTPPNRSVALTFEQLELDPTRPLHAKCLWFEGAEWLLYVCGSSNFTTAGLGIGYTKNFEANLAYAVNFMRHSDAFRACDDAWFKHAPPLGDPVLIPPPETGEDSPLACDPILPSALGSAIFARDADGLILIEFSFRGVPPVGWQASPEDETAIFFDDAAWAAAGRPNTMRVTWDSVRPPAGFRVTWPGAEGVAWWPVNVRDGASLPPPAELNDLPLEVLIEILTSAKPLHLALARWLKRQRKQGEEGPAILTNASTLRRFCSSALVGSLGRSMDLGIGWRGRLRHEKRLIGGCAARWECRRLVEQ